MSRKNPYFSSRVLVAVGLATALSATGLIACAPAPVTPSNPASGAAPGGSEGPAVTTDPAPTTPAPETRATAVTANDQADTFPADDSPAPPGKLVCKVTADGNAHQLYLEWDGDTAKGTLRTSTPSGMVRSEPVKAERYKARVVIDDPEPTDLAVHKATVVDDGRSKKIQLGDHTRPWSTCN